MRASSTAKVVMCKCYASYRNLTKNFVRVGVYFSEQLCFQKTFFSPAFGTFWNCWRWLTYPTLIVKIKKTGLLPVSPI